MSERLAALRPQFEALGHRDWHDETMDRIAELAAAASGSRDRVAS
jgi:hypothetical protein